MDIKMKICQGIVKNNYGILTKHIRKQIIAVDFDGTLSLGRFPDCGPGNECLINLLKKLISRPAEDRNYYVLWTSRSREYLQNAVSWLQGQGLTFDTVNCIPPELLNNLGDTRKIPALYYVDDRAISPGGFIDMWSNVEKELPE
jgi:hypothetical protein